MGTGTDLLEAIRLDPIKGAARATVNASLPAVRKNVLREIFLSCIKPSFG